MAGSGVDRSNRATTDRLRTLAGRLSDEELSHEIDPPWTASGLFAHIAFWDRFVLERWQLAAARGERTPMQVDDGLMNRINDAALDQWMSIPPRKAVDLCTAAAAAIDVFVAGIDAAVREALVSEGRERLADRSLHREDHLRTLEGAFPPA
jgi:DinB superfamily